jgi:hypothetical protein
MAPSTANMCYVARMRQIAHETLLREERSEPGSERAFAITVAAALVILGIVNWWHSGDLWPALFATSTVCAVLGWYWPNTLKPFNRAWFKFGLILHAKINPILMAIVFFSAVVPMGLVMRAIGKDPLRLKRENNKDSYWIAREPPGPRAQSFKDQF